MFALKTILVLMVLRYGPKLYLLQDLDSVDEDEDEDDGDEFSITEDDESHESIEAREKGAKHESTLSSTINSYDTFRNPDLKSDNLNLVDILPDGHTLGKNITSHYDGTPSKSNLISLENKEQTNLHVVFNTSVENINDINSPQTMLNIPPDKKNKRQRQQKSSHSGFNS